MLSHMEKQGDRKRKVTLGESEPSIQIKTRRLEPDDLGNYASDRVLVSCCSSSELNLKSLDLEEENENEVTVEFLATTASDSVDFSDRRETTPSSEAQIQSGELESTTVKMPSEDELEEFFAAAERNLQKQFIHKYNYDIIKDEPLEGRYEWIQTQLKP